LFFVATPIRVDLRVPVFSVRLRTPLVIRAAVPEAAVDKHRDTSAREYDIGARETAFERQR
jgi:hypothetical protein